MSRRRIPTRDLTLASTPVPMKAVATTALQLAHGRPFESRSHRLELIATDEIVLPDGRVSRKMTAGLLRRHAHEQSTYRTLTLCAKLELSLEYLRELSPALAEYSSLSTLRLDHNLLSSLSSIQLPQLKVLSVHHNRITHLGDDLRGVPLLLQLDVGTNRLTSLAGIEHLSRLTSLLAPNNSLADEAALAPLLGGDGALAAVLSSLELHDNGLTTLAALTPLSSLRELRSLRLKGNRVLEREGRSTVLAKLTQVRKTTTRIRHVVLLRPVPCAPSHVRVPLCHRCACSMVAPTRSSCTTNGRQ